VTTAIVERNEEVRALDIILKEKRDKHQDINREISAANSIYAKALGSTKSVRAEREKLSNEVEGLRSDRIKLTEDIKKLKEDYKTYQTRIDGQIDERGKKADARIEKAEKAEAAAATAEQKAQTAHSKFDSRVATIKTAAIERLLEVDKTVKKLTDSLA